MTVGANSTFCEITGFTEYTLTHINQSPLPYPIAASSDVKDPISLGDDPFPPPLSKRIKTQAQRSMSHMCLPCKKRNATTPRQTTAISRNDANTDPFNHLCSWDQHTLCWLLCSFAQLSHVPCCSFYLHRSQACTVEPEQTAERPPHYESYSPV